jgi:transcriptional regulator with XRE-family HTH domain
LIGTAKTERTWSREDGTRYWTYLKKDLIAVRRAFRLLGHLRQAVGHTVETLASASGLPGEYIEAVEAGRVELSVRALVVICEALGLSGAILFRKNGDQE